MSKLSPQAIVEKADLAIANLTGEGNGGYLNPIQANFFIRKLVDQPTIINQMRVVPMNAPTMEINKIGFSDRILRAAPQSGTALSGSGWEEHAAPETQKIELATKEVIAEVWLPYDVLEDNIERGVLENTIMDMITERASIDLEELVLLGIVGAADPYLGLMNGILVSANDHVVEYTTPPNDLDIDIFKAGFQAMPVKYLRNRSQMKFYTSHYVETEFAAIMAMRETAMGDARMTEDYMTQLKAFGVPIAPCALMPSGNYIFTLPQNLILGVQRKIMIETARKIRYRSVVIVVTMRLAFAIEETDAVVKVSGLTSTGTTTY